MLQTNICPYLYDENFKSRYNCIFEDICKIDCEMIVTMNKDRVVFIVENLIFC